MVEKIKVGKTYYHRRTGNPYQIIGLPLVKGSNDLWSPGVLYEGYTGLQYCRTADSFKAVFTETKPDKEEDNETL